MPEAIREIEFWKENTKSLNFRKISEHHLSSINGYSDDSNSGIEISIPRFEAQSHRNLKYQRTGFKFNMTRINGNTLWADLIEKFTVW